MEKETLNPASVTASTDSVAILGGNNVINDTALISRFLSIIEEQSRTIERQHNEITRLLGIVNNKGKTIK